MSPLRADMADRADFDVIVTDPGKAFVIAPSPTSAPTVRGLFRTLTPGSLKLKTYFNKEGGIYYGLLATVSDMH